MRAVWRRIPWSRKGARRERLTVPSDAGSAPPTRPNHKSTTAGRKRPIRTPTSCWSTSTPEKWAISVRPSRARPTTRKRPMRPRWRTQSRPHWLRIRACRAMSLRVSSRSSPKTTARPGLECRPSPPASPLLQCACSGGKCDGRGQTVPDCQRCLTSDDRWHLGSGHGDGVWLAQSPRQLSSPVTHIRCPELTDLWLNPDAAKLIFFLQGYVRRISNVSGSDKSAVSCAALCETLPGYASGWSRQRDHRARQVCASAPLDWPVGSWHRPTQTTPRR